MEIRTTLTAEARGMTARPTTKGFKLLVAENDCTIKSRLSCFVTRCAEWDHLDSETITSSNVVARQPTMYSLFWSNAVDDDERCGF